MQRLIVLALTVLALAAVSVAFGDNGGTPAAGAASASIRQGRTGNRFPLSALRIRIAERLFVKLCSTSANGASERCLDAAKKAKDRLTKLDASVQARIAKIQQACGSASTDLTCTNAADRLALLQKLDERVQALAQKVQDRLDGKTVSTSTAGQIGGNG
jgi:hypothetical protein